MASTFPPEKVIEQMDRFVEQHHVTGLTAIFSVAIPDEFVSKILSIPQTVSLVFASQPENLPNIDPGRIGWLHPDGQVGRFPDSVGTCILVFGEAEAFGYELAKLSLNSGAGRVAFDTPFGFTKPQLLWPMLADRTLRGIDRFLHRQVKGMTSHPIIDHCYRNGLGPLVKTFNRKVRYAKLLKHLSQEIPKDDCVLGRLAFVTGSLGPGGAERQLLNTLQGLSQRGKCDMHLLAGRLSPEPHDFYLPKARQLQELSVIELGAANEHSDTGRDDIKHLVQRLPPAFRSEVLHLVLIFKRLRPEVVHAWQDGPSAKAGLAAVLSGVHRIVLSWRSLSPLITGLHQPCYAPILQALAERNDVVLLNNSAAGAKSYASWLGINASRINVIHNSIDLSNLKMPDADVVRDYRARLGIPTEALVLGTIFRFGPEKRPMLWLETAIEVAKRRPDVHFLMIGDGLLYDQVKTAAAQAGLSERLHMPGRTATPSLALAAMDIFLLTSELEGLPNVIIEAGALGIPVVSTDVGGVREALDHGRTGLAVPTAEPGLLANNILECLSDGDWLDAARTQAPAWVRQRFSTDRMIDRTLEAFGGSESAKPDLASDERFVGVGRAKATPTSQPIP